MTFTRLKRLLRPAGAPQTPVDFTTRDVLDHYVQGVPTAQNAVDLFRAQWVSRFPDETVAVTGGNALLFQDPRVAWGIEALGGMRGKTALELGPMEGGHTYMLHQAGARSVVAIEANTRAFLRCLVVKDVFGLDGVRFLLGDFVEYLRQTKQRFDVCVCAGVLYHMTNPVELIELMARHADAVYCWTHYYDDASMRANPNPDVHQHLATPTPLSHAGFTYEGYRHLYGRERQLGHFCGPGTATATWMTRADIERCFRHFGYTRFETAHEEPQHLHGPSFSFVTSR